MRFIMCRPLIWENLFMQLLNRSLIVSCIIFAVFIVRLILKKAPKNLRLILWGMVALQLLFPFKIESRLSLIPDPDPVNTACELVFKSNDEVSSDSGYETDEVLQPDRIIKPVGRLISSISKFYLAGFILTLLYTAVSYISLKYKVRVSIKLSNNIYLCDYLSSAFILGLIHPIIYIPTSVEEHDYKYIIAHEKEHIKHFDYIIKPLAFLILAIYWFNPVIWLAFFSFSRDLEFACDERVIKKMDNSDKKAYSRALLKCSAGRKVEFSYPLGFSELGVKGRIRTALSYTKPSIITIIFSVCACLFVTLCFMTIPEKRTAYLDILHVESRLVPPIMPTDIIEGNSLKVDHIGDGEICYTVKSTALSDTLPAENCLDNGDGGPYLLVEIEVTNISVPPDSVQGQCSLINCFTLCNEDGTRIGYGEPVYFDRAWEIYENNNKFDSKLYFAYVPPTIGESSIYTLAWSLKYADSSLFSSNMPRLMYIHTGETIPLKLD